MKHTVAEKKEGENLSFHVNTGSERVNAGLEPHSKVAESKCWMWLERESPEA